MAACDADLLGKVLEEGELQLAVKPEFYDGMAVTREQLISHLQVATIGNFVGQETVRVVLEEGFIDEDHIITIDGVPHAQMVVI